MQVILRRHIFNERKWAQVMPTACLASSRLPRRAQYRNGFAWVCYKKNAGIWRAMSSGMDDAQAG